MRVVRSLRAALCLAVSVAMVCAGQPAPALAECGDAPVLGSASGYASTSGEALLLAPPAEERSDGEVLDVASVGAMSGRDDSQAHDGQCFDVEQTDEGVEGAPQGEEMSQCSSGEASAATAASASACADVEPCLEHRVLVGLRTEELSSALAEGGQLLSSHEGLCLLGYESEEAADAATRELSERSDVVFAARDRAYVAVDEGAARESSACTASGLREDALGNPVVDLGGIDLKVASSEAACEPLVALVDTGAPEGVCVVGRAGVLGQQVADDNGHATEMLSEMQEISSGAVRVLSIKALDARGRGTTASVYMAIMLAIEAKAQVINLSFGALASGDAAIAEAVRQATDAGILVVAAAGDQGGDAANFVPAGIEGVLCVGALEAAGTPQDSTNAGVAVDAWVIAQTSARAAARLSAWLTANSSFAQAYRDLSSEPAQLAGIFGSLAVQSLAEKEDTSEKLLLAASSSAEDNDVASASTEPVLRGRVYLHEAGEEGTWSEWVENEAKTEEERNVWHDCGGNGYISAIQFALETNGGYSGGVEYALDSGETASDGAIAGEASAQGPVATRMRLRLTGELAEHYDIGYQVHDRKSAGGMDSLPRNGAWAAHCETGIDRIAWNLIRKTWTVTFMDGSSVLGTQTVRDGSSAVAPELPCKQGYRSLWDRSCEDICADTTISVVYVPDPAQGPYRQRVLARYQNADGSFGVFETVLDDEYAPGSSCSWLRPEDDLFQEVSLSYEVGAEHTAYVDVCRKLSRVAFDGNGATQGAMEELALYAGGRRALEPCAFVRTGYDFMGWNTMPDGSGMSLADCAVVGEELPQRGTLTLFAQWRARQLSVSVPVAISCVAKEDGAMSAEIGAKAAVKNRGEAPVGITDIDLELMDPWHLVSSEEVMSEHDVALGLSLGNGERLDFSELSSPAEPFVEIPAMQSVCINGLTGSVGVAPGEDVLLGSLRWCFSAL